MKIQKLSDKNNISIFDVLAEQQNAPVRTNEDKTPKIDWSGMSESRQPEMKSAWRKQREEEKKAERDGRYSQEPQTAQRLKHNDCVDPEKMDMTRSAHSVRSSRSSGE